MLKQSKELIRIETYSIMGIRIETETYSMMQQNVTDTCRLQRLESVVLKNDSEASLKEWLCEKSRLLIVSTLIWALIPVNSVVWTTYRNSRLGKVGLNFKGGWTTGIVVLYCYILAHIRAVCYLISYNSLDSEKSRLSADKINARVKTFLYMRSQINPRYKSRLLAQSHKSTTTSTGSARLT
jgi:hypothetical protein